MNSIPLTDREKQNRRDAVLAFFGGTLPVKTLAHSIVESHQTGGVAYTKNVYGEGSARDLTVYTLRNYINGDKFVGTMKEAAAYMLTHGYITEKRNWAGTMLVQKKTAHCKGWQIVY